MGGRGSGRRDWTDEQRAAKVKPEKEKRMAKTISLYLSEMIRLKGSAQNLGINESEYIRQLLNQEDVESIAKVALILKNHYDIQEKNIEMLENALDEMIREQENLAQTLKKLGLKVN